MLSRSFARSVVPRSVALRTFPALLRIPRPQSTTPAAAPTAALEPARIAFGARTFHTTMSTRAISTPAIDNTKPAVDKVVRDIADYVHSYQIDSPLAVRDPLPFD